MNYLIDFITNNLIEAYAFITIVFLIPLKEDLIQLNLTTTHTTQHVFLDKEDLMPFRRLSVRRDKVWYPLVK